MRVYWAKRQEVLNIEAETPDELDLIGDLMRGPLSRANQLHRPATPDDVHGVRGVDFRPGADMYQVVGLAWDVRGERGLGNGRTPAQVLHADAAQQLGSALFKCLDVFHSQRATDLAGAAAGVVPVEAEG